MDDTPDMTSTEVDGPPGTWFALGLREWLAIWRIWGAWLVIQLLGRKLSPFVGDGDPMDHAYFWRIWLGSVLVIAGVGVGLLWQLVTDSKSFPKLWKPIVAFVVIAHVIFGLRIIIGLSTIYAAHNQTEVAGHEKLERMLQFPPGSVTSIRVYQEYGQSLIKEITDREALDGFIPACQDAAEYRPNHPHYTDSWYLVIEADETFEFMAHYQPARPGQVVLYLTDQYAPMSFRFSGTFISTSLRPWFEGNVGGVDSAP